MNVTNKPPGGNAVDRALHDDLHSSSDNDNDDDDDDDDDDDTRAHSFRERRLTYTRHHIVSDSAAAAVAEFLDGDDNDNETADDDDDDGDDGKATTAYASTDASTDASTTKRKRSESTSSDKSQDKSPSSNKRFKGNDGNSLRALPSRILHAGEIVRRSSLRHQSSSADYDGIRTGAHSHPSHPRNQQQQQHAAGADNNGSNESGGGGAKCNKWRRRFSFCSTAPDRVLPFPRKVVGTYSCHGMEPVYDSDYSDSSDDNDNDNNLESENGGERNGSKSTAKINQDRGGIAYPYGDSTTQALFAVYDGHGDGGEMVSQYALGEVSRLLEGRLREWSIVVEERKKQRGTKRKTKKGGPSGLLKRVVEEEADEVGGEEGGKDGGEGEKGGDQRQQQQEEEEEEYIARAMRETFETVDRGLLDETDIEPMYSGTTACVVLLRNNKLHISNCGDSRAVLARKSDGNPKETKNESDNQTASERRNLTTIPLSIDQNPDSPGEKERILSSGGYVSPPPEPGLSSRVWLDAANTQIGLAMARSIGDHAVKGVGVIAEPVVTTHDLEAGDEFLIIATDGVWEFISSEDAVEIVGRHLYGDGGDDDDGGGSVACEALIKAASEKWHEHEGDYRDDITAIVIRLKDLLS